VHADVARHALELLRQLEQVRTSSLDALGQLGSAAMAYFLLAARARRRVLQRDGLAGLVGDQLAMPSQKGSSCPARGPRRGWRLGGHGAEGGDLADRVAPYLSFT
jgi:hypothetical protein